MTKGLHLRSVTGEIMGGFFACRQAVWSRDGDSYGLS
jgi:hypothetical protein